MMLEPIPEVDGVSECISPVFWTKVSTIEYCAHHVSKGAMSKFNDTVLFCKGFRCLFAIITKLL